MTTKTEQATKTQSNSAWKIIGVIFLFLVIAMGFTIWQAFREIFPGKFEPVTLSMDEERVLEQKLARIDPTRLQPVGVNQPPSEALKPLVPETKSNAKVDSELTFTEKELNAMLAKYSTLAHLVAIDLSDNLFVVRELIPFDPDFPLIGGRAIEMILTFEASLEENRPALHFKAARIWSTEIPETWIDNKTNAIMGNVYEVEKGFWEAFAKSVENIAVSKGALQIKLRE